MNSAAKLRKRSVATLAASALIIGGIAPAAFAFTAPPSAPNSSDDAGAASIGLVDSDPSEAGTQGAQIVTPGGSGQDMGEVRFVIPATFEQGDSYTFKIGASSPSALTDRTSFSSTPAVAFDPQAYDSTTHVADYSSTYSAAGTEKTSSEAAGSTEGGKLTKYVPDNTTKMAANAPQFDVALSSSGGNNYNDQVTITFRNNSDPGSNTAKFIGSLRGKIDVGTTVTGDIPLSVSSADGAGGGSGNDPAFFGDSTANRNVTYPATVSGASLEVASGNVVADGTDQYVGPITVQAANGSNLGGTVRTELSPSTATFVTPGSVTATAYDSTGKVVATPTVTVGANSLEVTGLANTVTKVVFSGMAVTAPNGATRLTYTLTSAGNAIIPTGNLGGVSANRHQLDIKAPKAVTVTQGTATENPTRLGGQDRYQTAVKLAEWDLGTDVLGPKGESDNVVIASGEGFADALSSGYLAATKNAKLILTRQGSLPQTDIEFLKTYGAKNIYIVGGYGSVSKAVEDQLKGMQSYDVQAEGQTVATQRTVHDGTISAGNGATLSAPITYTGEATAPTPVINTAYTDVAGDSTTPYELSGITSGTAGYTVTSVNTTAGTATLTTPWGDTATVTVPTSNATVATVARSLTVADATRQITTTVNQPGDVDAAQGTARKVVPLQANLTVTRLAGADRFETNKKVNMYAAETATNPVGITVPEYGKASRKTGILANGMAPWDALAAGPLVGNADGQNPIPVILTRGGDTMTQYAADQIGQMDIKHLLFVGGKGVLSDALISEGNTRGITVNRLGGNTRWETARAVSEFALKAGVVSATNTAPGFGFGNTVSSPFLANGGSMDGNTGSKVAQGAWADALAAGPVAANNRMIIALTDSEKLPEETKAMLTKARAQLKTVLAIGLGGVVSTNVVNAANDAVTK